jgi:hypothetical protein
MIAKSSILKHFGKFDGIRLEVVAILAAKNKFDVSPSLLADGKESFIPKGAWSNALGMVVPSAPIALLAIE